VRPYRIAVDIGGTFVDALQFDRRTHTIRLEKTSTTPGDPARGVMEALAKLGTDLTDAEIFVHGTTLGLNAILERKGALTGIITNLGFRDIFEIGRGDVPPAHMYDFRYEKPPSLVKRRHRVGAPGRINVHGEVVEPLDEVALVEAARTLVEAQGVRSLAVCFLHSYKNPEHERRAARILRDAFPDVTVSISSDVTREYREYERTSTTVLDAYIRPIFEAYVDRLEQNLHDHRFGGNFLIMRSSGGAMTADTAKTSPIFTVLSGPAGGVVGAGCLARALGKARLVSVDFGGTSLDACVIADGTPTMMHEASLAHYPVLMPIFDIRCIGAGGGSIAWLEEGLLKVGPRSAGAVPGPIAYGKGGTEPTTTDAALALRYLDPGGFLKGEMALNAAASREGIERVVARPLDIDIARASAGMFDVVMARTVGAIREITVERGYDPREFSLLAFGGAGPLFAPLLAREMGIPETIVPQAPAAFSAWGMLMSDLAADYSRTQVALLDDLDLTVLESAFLELEEQSAAALRRQGIGDRSLVIQRALELRYLGQEHALEVALSRDLSAPDIRKLFESLHEARYGHTTSDPIQTVTLRVHGIGLVEKPELRPLAAGDGNARRARTGSRDAYCFALRRWTMFDIYRRDQLQPGDHAHGPAIVDEGTSTTVVHSDQSLSVDIYGHLIIHRAD
jgi:N-methylhydantoinase A